MSWDNEEEVSNIKMSYPEIKKDLENEKFIEETDKIIQQEEKNSINAISEHETILIYGQPKVGKTFAVCSLIENTIKKGNKVYIINTDNGIKRTLKAYFNSTADEVSKYISYFLVLDFNKIFDIVKEIKSKVKSNDLIVIDLIDDFWEMAQMKFVEDISGGDIVNYISLASRDKEKFGLLEGTKWQYAKKLDDMIVRGLVIYPPCNIVACCSAKDIEVAKVFARKDADALYELSKYDEVGSRPAGQKMLHYKFNTVIYLGEKKDGKRYFVVMGDRGFLKSNKVDYGKNFYEAFSGLRK